MHQEVKDSIIKYIITKHALSNKQHVIDLDQDPTLFPQKPNTKNPQSVVPVPSVKIDELNPQVDSEYTSRSEPARGNPEQNTMGTQNKVIDELQTNNQIKKQVNMSKQVQKNVSYQFVQEEQENKIESSQDQIEKPVMKPQTRPRGRPKSKVFVKVKGYPKKPKPQIEQKVPENLIPLKITIPLTIKAISFDERQQPISQKKKQEKTSNHKIKPNSIRLIANTLKDADTLPEKQIKPIAINKPSILKQTSIKGHQEIAISSTSTISNQQTFKSKSINSKIKSNYKIEEIRTVPQRIQKNKISYQENKGTKGNKKLQNKDNNQRKVSALQQKQQISENRSKCAVDLDSFFQRRLLKNHKKIDLGVYSLSEILEKANNHEIISNELYYQFIRVHKQEKILSFIQMVANNSLSDWDSTTNKFTIADHRRLSQLLVKVYPNKYTLTSPQSLNSDINQFIFQLYSLSKNKYSQLMRELDKQFQVSWWRSIQIKYYQFLHERADPAFKNNKYLNQFVKSPEMINLQTYSEQVLGELNKKYKLGNSNQMEAQNQGKKPTRQQNSKNVLNAQINNYNNLTRSMKFIQKPVKIEAQQSRPQLKRSFNYNYLSEQQRNYDILTKKLRK